MGRPRVYVQAPRSLWLRSPASRELPKEQASIVVFAPLKQRGASTPVHVGPSVTEHIDTERLRKQHPIADVVERYGIELRRSGSGLVGRCPFHSDAGRPNLVVYPRSARFVCFRCQVRGDAIAFVLQIDGGSTAIPANSCDTATCGGYGSDRAAPGDTRRHR